MIGSFLMKPLLLHSDLWDDYALIDSGNGVKLERFGRYFFSRPDTAPHRKEHRQQALLNYLVLKKAWSYR